VAYSLNRNRCNIAHQPKRSTSMGIIPDKLKPAQAEVHKTAHDQDLVEVPKRARLDREAEHKKGAQETQGRT
jgi:hypothetical protein